MPITDEEAALQAIATLAELSTEQQEALTSINTILHNGEPFVDVHVLFAHYNLLYFRNLLLPRVEVLWSPRLTLCAGICELSKDPSTGKLTRIRLKLSTPLLQYRPRTDTVNTLLHEAIHAYFFITTSWRHSRGDEGTGHGVGFQLLADAINNHGNYDVTIYHTFHDEVESFRTHVWQCDGPCRSQPPYFGVVKRSMNRAPGKSDTWWLKHENECGGMYVKIQEPAPTKKQVEAMSAKERAGRQKNKLDGWVRTGAKKDSTAEGNTSSHPNHVLEDKPAERTSKKRKVQASEPDSESNGLPAKERRTSLVHIEGVGGFVAEETLVKCPICQESVADLNINDHLDVVHNL